VYLIFLHLPPLPIGRNIHVPVNGFISLGPPVPPRVTAPGLLLHRGDRDAGEALRGGDSPQPLRLRRVRHGGRPGGGAMVMGPGRAGMRHPPGDTIFLSGGEEGMGSRVKKPGAKI